jgi:hypothetical protein
VFVSSVFAYRGLFMWLNPAAYFFNKMLVPLMRMSFFSLLGLFGGAQPLAFYLVGNAVIVAYAPPSERCGRSPGSRCARGSSCRRVAAAASKGSKDARRSDRAAEGGVASRLIASTRSMSEAWQTRVQ